MALKANQGISSPIKEISIFLMRTNKDVAQINCSLWLVTQNHSTQSQATWTIPDTIRVHFGLILKFINANLGIK